MTTRRFRTRRPFRARRRVGRRVWVHSIANSATVTAGDKAVLQTITPPQSDATLLAIRGAYGYGITSGTTSLERVGGILTGIIGWDGLVAADVPVFSDEADWFGYDPVINSGFSNTSEERAVLNTKDRAFWFKSVRRMNENNKRVYLVFHNVSTARSLTVNIVSSALFYIP